MKIVPSPSGEPAASSPGRPRPSIFGAFLFVTAAAAAAQGRGAPPASSAGAHGGAIQVGPNVLVSRDDQAYAHEEVQLGASPTDPNQLVACTIVEGTKLSQRKMHTAAYVSNDGGKAWKMGPQIPESGDPVCGYGPDGGVYFGAIGDSPSRDPAIDWHFKLYRSADSGKTWEQKSDIVTGDRPWLAFDATKSPNHGWLYLAYQSRAGVLDSQEKEPAVSLDLTHSSDNGTTWSLPKAYGVITARRLAHSLPTMMATLTDGTVVISNWQNLKKRATADEEGLAAAYPGQVGPPTCEISIVFVDANGWKRPKTVKAADKYCSETQTTRTVDAMAIDTFSDAFRDRIYLAWTDVRSGHSRIMFTHSADRGATWYKARVVDDVPGGLGHSPDNFMPSLAVNKDGVVGLTWNDRRENRDNIGYVTRFAASLDGGETWLPSARVGEQSARFRQGLEGETIAAYVSEAEGGHGPLTLQVMRAGGSRAGDTAGLAADARGVFHALWIDNRNGLDQLYTAPVTVAGAVRMHGSAELSSLSDISGSVAVDVADIVYEPKTQVFTVQAALRSKAKEPIRGRIVARVLAPRSQAGALTVVNADNGVSGAGATFDFTRSMGEGVLQPAQSTAPKTLKFQLKDIHLPAIEEASLWRTLQLEFIDLDLEILGERPAPPAEPAK